MPSAPIPDFEPLRLRAVWALGAAPEGLGGYFDRAAGLIARTLGAPLCVITLLREHDLVTLGASDGSRQAYPRGQAMCAWTAVAPGPVVVADASLDPRFADLPDIAQHGYRFYAGVPIADRRGVPVGCVCVMGRQARALSAAEVETLEGFAALVGHAVVSAEAASPALRGQELLAGLFDASLSGVIVAGAVRDAAGQIVDFRPTLVNARGCEVLGVAMEEMLTRTMGELFPNYERDGFFDLYRRVVETGEPEGMQRKYTDERLGAWFAVSAVPHGDGLAISFIDVTEPRAARSMAEQFFALSTDLLAIKSSEGEFLGVNPAWEATLGRPAGELLGTRCIELVHPDDVQRSVEACERLASGEPVVGFVNRYRAADGTYRLLRWNAARNPEDGRIYAVAHDDSDRRISEEHLRLFIEHTPAAVAVLDREMRYLAVSRRWKEDYALGEARLEGRSHYDVFPDVPRRWREIHRRCLEGAVERCEEDRFERADGSVVWIRWEVRPWLGPDGSVGGVIMFTEVVTQQVHAREQLRAQEEMLRLALSAAEMVPLEWDVAADSVHIGPTAAEHLGLDAGSGARHASWWFERIHPADAPGVAQQRRVVMDGEAEAVEFEFRLRRDNGSWGWVMCAARVVRRDGAGRPAVLAGVLRDVTQARRGRLRLRRAALRLQSDKRAIAAALEAAEAANRAKSTFLANVSHELRTPLAAIVGYAELLGEADGAMRQEAAGVVRRNGEHVLSLVNDILDLARVEADRLPMEPRACELLPLLEDAARTFALRASDKGVTLAVHAEGPLPEAVRTDPVRLRQILVNLLGNAIKFTDSGRIDLTARRGRGPDPRLEIEVSDTGIGVPPDRLAELFAPFSQIDPSASRRHGGAGLGLSISRGLARRMGGDLVCARTAPGEGTVMRLTLPLRTADTPPAPTGPVEPAPLAARVLIADDGSDNRRLLAHILTATGAAVQEAGDGVEAVRVALEASAEGRPFDVILMDLQMPALDGYAATRRLRESGYTRPIIALTAHAGGEDRDTCLRAGFDDYATKPLPRAALIELCRRWAARADRRAA